MAERPCSECGQRPATYVRARGGPRRRRKDHDLCQECWRNAGNAVRSERMKERARPAKED